MEIVNTEIYEENGVKYQKDTYDTGMVITYPWQDPDAPPPPEPEPEPPQMSKTDKVLMAITDTYEQNEEIKQDNLTILAAITDLYESEAK